MKRAAVDGIAEQFFIFQRRNVGNISVEQMKFNYELYENHFFELNNVKVLGPSDKLIFHHAERDFFCRILAPGISLF